MNNEFVFRSLSTKNGLHYIALRYFEIITLKKTP